MCECVNLLTSPYAKSDGGLMHETRVDRDIQLKIVRKQSSRMSRRPGTAAATGARQRSGKEERAIDSHIENDNQRTRS